MSNPLRRIATSLFAFGLGCALLVSAKTGAYETSDRTSLTPEQPFELVATPDVVYQLAPRLRLHPEEQFWPLSAHTFIDNSDLIWAHDDGCNDHPLDTTPAKTTMASGGYRHVTTSAGCDHQSTTWFSNQTVRPREDGGPGGGEGMFLNINNAYRDGQGFGNDEPVYYSFNSGSQIVYWFHYAYSQTLNIAAHEGDWERIAIRLNASNQPQEVQYFQHHTSCTLPWSDVPKAFGRPVLWITKEAHGSYPAGADAHSGDRISGSGPLWTTSDNLDRLGEQPWYGFGGGWGEVGNFSDTTGPDAPPHKGEPGFGTARCDMS